MPKIITATMKRTKLACFSAKTAVSTATTQDIDDRANPFRLPILRMSKVAGIVVAATATTIIDNGSVANALLLLRFEPMIPPSITITIDPDVDISWQITRRLRLRTCIHCADEDHGGAFSHIGDNVDTLEVSDEIRIPMPEIQMTAIRSQGAGGQNVNKVASAIHLRFDIKNCGSIPSRVKQRLLSQSDHRITDDGIVIIKSQTYRPQDKNRQAALGRLAELVLSATREPKRRIKTKPSKKARQRRLDAKSRRGALKKTRRSYPDD